MPNDGIDSIYHLLKAAMGKYLREIIKSDPSRKKCECLPKIETESKVSIGTWLASSFLERLNSVANKLVTKKIH